MTLIILRVLGKNTEDIHYLVYVLFSIYRAANELDQYEREQSVSSFFERDDCSFYCLKKDGCKNIDERRPKYDSF